MALPDGMYFYEFVLLLLGSLLFLTLLTLLIVFAVQKRSMKGLLAFFPIPIIMIGFPSYQKISYDNGVVSLEKLTRQVSADPGNDSARSALKQGIADVTNRAEDDPQAMLKVGEAHAALGDTLKALEIAENEYRKDSTLPNVKQLITRYQAPLLRIDQQAGAVAAHPTDTARKTTLVKDLRELEQGGTQSPSVLVTRAKIHAQLGDTAKAIRLADSAAKLDPRFRDATLFRRKLVRP